MENVIGILIVITFIAFIAYSGSQIRKQEEKLRVESIKQKQKRDKAKLIIQLPRLAFLLQIFVHA